MPTSTDPRTAPPGAGPDALQVDPVDPTTLRLSGDVDLAAVARLCGPGTTPVQSCAEAAGRALGAAGVRTVDARAVTFADSSLVHLVTGLAEAARPERVALRACTAPVRLVLEAAGAGRAVDVGHPTPSPGRPRAALQAPGPRPAREGEDT